MPYDDDGGEASFAGHHPSGIATVASSLLLLGRGLVSTVRIFGWRVHPPRGQLSTGNKIA